MLDKLKNYKKTKTISYFLAIAPADWIVIGIRGLKFFVIGIIQRI